MDIENIRAHWYAYIYDRQETQTDDVAFILRTLGDEPLRILEAGCGSGRILAPLARAGHAVHGFDLDDEMMARIGPKVAGLSGVCYWKADMLEDRWGEGYDTVILAGNILINIETAGDYQQAQRLIIQKAADALRPGGHALLDFDLHARPERVFCYDGERIFFEGLDDRGVYGRYGHLSCRYDPHSKMCTTRHRTELTLPGGERHTFDGTSAKHIPTLHDAMGWLEDAGLGIEWALGGYDGRPIGLDTHRAILWAGKA